MIFNWFRNYSEFQVENSRYKFYHYDNTNIGSSIVNSISSLYSNYSTLINNQGNRNNRNMIKYVDCNYIIYMCVF
jgi:hypothetical protein